MLVLSMIFIGLTFSLFIWDLSRKREYYNNFCYGYYQGEKDYIRQYGHRILDAPEFYDDWLRRTKTDLNGKEITLMEVINMELRNYQQNKLLDSVVDKFVRDIKI